MILLWLILVPILGAALAWFVKGQSPDLPRWISIGVLTIDLLLALTLVGAPPAGSSSWIAQYNQPWVPQLGMGFRLGLDGLSLVLILLTLVLSLISVVISWTEITDRVGFFHFNLLLVTAGVVGVFLALDLFLFFFFWELMLVPMYFLIALWGHEERYYAAIKFFIFTQASGLLMLVAIIALAFVHERATGVFTFDYAALLGTKMSPTVAMLLMLGFFIAFAVKLPAFLVHTWLPDAHTEAPTAGSVILAGVLLKTGAYGMLRFVVPLFPEAAMRFAPIAMLLAVAGIIYGAILAFAQTDMKRLVAYSSVSHMGFVLLGIFAWNALALQGVVAQMVAHGISTGALFILVGALQERIHTRDMRLMGGLWGAVPRLAAVFMFFAIASLGLPGLGNFIGEFMILLGGYRASIPFTAVATLGVVAAAVYALAVVQRGFLGAGPPEALAASGRLFDLSARHMTVMAALIVAIVAVGVYPQPMFDQAAPSLASLQHIASMPTLTTALR